MTTAEQRQAAGILERLARVVAGGEVTAPAGFVARLQGAAIALTASAGGVARADRSGSSR